MQALGTGHSAPPVSTQCVGKGANSDRLRLRPFATAKHCHSRRSASTATAVGTCLPACPGQRETAALPRCSHGIPVSLPPLNPHCLRQLWPCLLSLSPSSPSSPPHVVQVGSGPRFLFSHRAAPALAAPATPATLPCPSRPILCPHRDFSRYYGGWRQGGRAIGR